MKILKLTKLQKTLRKIKKFKENYRMVAKNKLNGGSFSYIKRKIRKSHKKSRKFAKQIEQI